MLLAGRFNVDRYTWKQIESYQNFMLTTMRRTHTAAILDCSFLHSRLSIVQKRNHVTSRLPIFCCCVSALLWLLQIQFDCVCARCFALTLIVCFHFICAFAIWLWRFGVLCWFRFVPMHSACAALRYLTFFDSRSNKNLSKTFNVHSWLFEKISSVFIIYKILIL